MAIRSIRRQATNPVAAPGTPNTAPIYVDSDDNILKMIPAGSGTTEVQVIDASSAQTLTNKTLTAPVITGGSASGLVDGDTKVLAATATFVTNTVLASLTGFSWSLVAGATYQFDVELFTTQTTNGGLQVAFKQSNSLTLTSIAAFSEQMSAAAIATAQFTTTTDASPIVNNKTAVYLATRITGTLVVGTAGTVQIQAAQNTSNSDTTSVLLGSYAWFVRTS